LHYSASGASACVINDKWCQWHETKYHCQWPIWSFPVTKWQIRGSLWFPIHVY